VIYNEKSGLEYDGSMVPAEWFGWLHYKTDFPPTEVSKWNHYFVGPVLLVIFVPPMTAE
jgi:NADH:ubiquinone oxidoreductase subunit